MKKSLLALSITSALTTLALPVCAGEQVIADTEQTETIVVTANRSTQDKFDVLAAMDVFTRADIEQIQPLSVADLLNRVAGITTIQQGTSASQTSVFVRGSNSDHVLLLVDGVRVGSATLGNKNLGDVPIQLIERIEIIRGPRAALWGSDAIGGVIQIFTRRLDHAATQFGVKLGSHNFWQAYGAIGFGNEQNSYTLSSSVEKSKGFDVITPDPSNPYAIDQADKDGYSREAIALTGSSQITSAYTVNVSAQSTQGKTQIDASFGGDETHYKNSHLVIQNQLQVDGTTLQLNLANSTDYNEDNADKLFPGTNKSFFETKRDQVTAQVQVPINTNGEITAGFDWYNEKIASQNNYAKTKRNASAFYLTGRQQINKLKFEGAIRHDKVGNINGETSYQLSLGFQAADNLLLVLSQGTAFKAPTFNDLYWPNAFGSAGNPHLKAETAKNVEFLTRYQTSLYSIEVSLYQTDFDNLIEWTPVDANNVFAGWQPSNVSQAIIKGGEATINADILGTSNTLTLSHIDAKNVTTGLQLARRPYFAANYRIDYQADFWDVDLEFNHQGARTDSNGKPLSSYTLINLVFNYQLSQQTTLSARITNLGDKDYFQITEYPGDRRGYSLALDYRF